MQASAPSSAASGHPRRAATGQRRFAATVWSLLPIVLPCVLFGAIAARRWVQIGPYVTGADPGNWFAFGRMLFGDGGKTTGGGYPPLIPLLLHVGRLLGDPMGAAKVVGIGSLVALMVAVYIIGRQTLAWWLALMAAVTVGLAGVNTETTAYGGYPQNYALAFGLVAALCFARYLEEGTNTMLGGTALLLGLAALSHHMYFAIAQTVLAAIWLLWVLSRPPTVVWLNRTLGLAVAEALSVVCFLPIYVALERAGFRPPVNAGGLSRQAALEFTLRDAPLLWVGLFTFGIVFTLLSAGSHRLPLWKVQAALVAAGAAGFIVTGEQRLIPLLMVGACLALGLALHTVLQRWRSRVAALAVPAVALAVPLVLLPRADARAAELYRYYRVANPSLLGAAAWVEAHHGDGRVVVRHDRNGWPIGWWFEGLTGADVAVGSSLRWLAFPRERDNARLAAQFFDQQLTGGQVAALAARQRVGLLVFRRWDWIGWQAWLEEPQPAVEIAYDDGQFMILRVRHP